MMPALLGAAQLALLAANLPLATTIAPVLALTVGRPPGGPTRATGPLVLPLHAPGAPPAGQLACATAVHVFAFAGAGAEEEEEEGEEELLLAESEGDFSMGEWEEAWGAARRAWVSGNATHDDDGEGMAVDSDGEEEGGVRLDGGGGGGAAREWLVGVVRG
jgi:exosome complex component RRP46